MTIIRKEICFLIANDERFSTDKNTIAFINVSFIIRNIGTYCVIFRTRT